MGKRFEAHEEHTIQEILQVMRLLQYLTMVLMSLYGHRELVKRASSAVTSEHLSKLFSRQVSDLLVSGLARPGERDCADPVGAGGC